MRIFKNKKGTEFLPLLMIFLILVLLYLSFVLFEEVNESPYAVGHMSKTLFDTYDEAYKSDLFIKNAAKQSMNNNLFKFAKTGGNPDNKCGEYFGYALITNKTDICYEDIEEKFIQKVKSDLKTTVLLIDYDIDFDIKISEKNPIVILGNSEDIYVPIFLDNTPRFTLTQSQPIDKTNPQDISEFSQEK